MAKKVTLNLNNYTKCLCAVCPVQGKESKCTEGKRKAWSETMAKMGQILEEYYKDPATYELTFDELEKHELAKKHGFKSPKNEEMLEMYCAIGKSDCDDLLAKEKCVCPDCKVWQSHDLKSYKYCLNGDADDIG